MEPTLRPIGTFIAKNNIVRDMVYLRGKRYCPTQDREMKVLTIGSKRGEERKGITSVR